MAKRGSSETYSPLLRLFKVDETFKEKDHLVIWSDSCASQNKNFHIVCLYQQLVLRGCFRIIDHTFPKVEHTYLHSDWAFGIIEKILQKNYVPDKYREIISTASRLLIWTNILEKTTIYLIKLRLFNPKNDELNEAVRFRVGIKWFRVKEYGYYLYKGLYDETMPFQKVNILNNKKIAEPPCGVEIERFHEKYGIILQEKWQNLQDQFKFVKLEYCYYYESILKKLICKIIALIVQIPHTFVY